AGQVCVARSRCVCVAAGGPDLVVTSLTVARAGGDCAVTATVRNDGNASAGASTLSVEGIAGNDRTTAVVQVPALAPHESRQQAATLRGLPCSSLNVVASADSRDQVREWVEGNNSLRQIFEAESPGR